MHINVDSMRTKLDMQRMISRTMRVIPAMIQLFIRVQNNTHNRLQTVWQEKVHQPLTTDMKHISRVTSMLRGICMQACLQDVATTTATHVLVFTLDPCMRSSMPDMVPPNSTVDTTSMVLIVTKDIHIITSFILRVMLHQNHFHMVTILRIRMYSMFMGRVLMHTRHKLWIITDMKGMEDNMANQFVMYKNRGPKSTVLCDFYRGTTVASLKAKHVLFV